MKKKCSKLNSETTNLPNTLKSGPNLVSDQKMGFRKKW